MNSLSWFLYIVDISTGIANFSVFLAVVSGIIGVVMMIVGAVCRDDAYHSSNQEARTRLGIRLQKISCLMVIPVVLFSLLAVLIPSKDALYMIGASQVGEQIVALEEVQEVGGEVGGLAKDAIALLREKIQSSLENKE